MTNLKAATLALALVVGATGSLACQREQQQSEQLPDSPGLGEGATESDSAPSLVPGVGGTEEERTVEPTQVPSGQELQNGATGDTVSPTEIPADDSESLDALPGGEPSGGMSAPGDAGGDLGDGASPSEGDAGTGRQPGGM